MYTLESSLKGLPVVSLQTGEMVALAVQPVLNVSNLEVIAISCLTPGRRKPMLVMTADIRQLAKDCLIIDDEDELTDPEDIIRISGDAQNPYSPLGKLVVADTGRKLGRVADYNINLETNRIQKLFVKPTGWRSWGSSTLTIDRTQIIDITPDHITVRDATVTDPLIGTEPVPGIHP